MKAWRRTSSIGAQASTCGIPGDVVLSTDEGSEVNLEWTWSGGDPGNFEVEFDLDSSGVWNAAGGSPVDGGERNLLFESGAGPDVTVTARIRAHCIDGSYGAWVVSNTVVIG